jgi:hypothetical protein
MPTGRVFARKKGEQRPEFMVDLRGLRPRRTLERQDVRGCRTIRGPTGMLLDSSLDTVDFALPITAAICLSRTPGASQVEYEANTSSQHTIPLVLRPVQEPKDPLAGSGDSLRRFPGALFRLVHSVVGEGTVGDHECRSMPRLRIRQWAASLGLYRASTSSEPGSTFASSR